MNITKFTTCLAAALALAGCTYRNVDCSKGVITTTSPDGKNEIRLYLNPLAYDVLRDGVTLVKKSQIGMKVDGACLTKGAAKPTAKARKVSGKRATPVNKKAEIDLAGNETFVDFGDWGIRLAARNDGVAYRFETMKAGEITVNCERAEVCVADVNARSWANYTGNHGLEETVPQAGALKNLATSADKEEGNWNGRRLIYLPFAYTIGGKTIAVTESDVFDYPIWDLTRKQSDDGDVFGSSFARFPKTQARRGGWNQNSADLEKGGRWIVVTSSEDYLVKTAGTRTFPWRTFILADQPAEIVTADIVRALATPTTTAYDFSWVKPGKVAWDWWNCWDNSPKGTPNEGCTTKMYERFIDFAAKNGVEYVIFDEGWSEKLNIWKFHPLVDVPHLIDYAGKKGVGIILWMAWAQVYGEEEKVASHFAKLGAKGFKVDFMDRGDAECARFLEKFAEACAKEKMVVDYHGAYRPVGLQQKYPNVLNFEGVHGLEQMKWHSENFDIMACDVRIAYLRQAAGPMDYTPGAMLNYAKGTYKTHDHYHPGSLGTRCRQMAMMALFEAPLQMLCDSPTNYEKNMESFRFMAATPVVWADSVALGGCPDSYIALARQAKDGAWYAAGMTNWGARDYTLDTAKFLGSGEWKAEIFRDADDADKNATHYVHETKAVKQGEKLNLRMAPGGGFVVRFTK